MELPKNILLEIQIRQVLLLNGVSQLLISPHVLSALSNHLTICHSSKQCPELCTKVKESIDHNFILGLSFSRLQLVSYETNMEILSH